MATPNQQKAALKTKEVLENKVNLTGAGILDFSGYSKAIQKNPKVVFESKGFQEALKALGFSIDAADMTIAKILRTGKEENQIKASQEIYKRLGAYEQEGGGNKIIQVFVTEAGAKKYGINTTAIQNTE